MKKFVVKDHSGYVNFFTITNGKISEYETSSKKSDAVRLNEVIAKLVSSELSDEIEVAE